jgi:hypothetical protein
MSGVGSRKKEELFAVLTRPPYPSLVEAAQMVGVEAQSVYNLNCSDGDFKVRWQNERARKRARQRDAARLRLEGAIERAVEVITAGLESEDEPTRLKTAWNMLDRVCGQFVTESEPQRPQSRADVILAAMIDED